MAQETVLIGVAMPEERLQRGTGYVDVGRGGA